MADGVRQQFTQKERDAETGLDYFGERYYSSLTGRFTTVDPLGASAKRTDPQTMNRYAYVLNNPLRFVDPDGLDAWDSLTKNERRLITPKLALAEGQLARDAFNKLVAGNTDQETATNVASVKNFIASVAGNSGAWQQIGSISRVSYQGVNSETNEQRSSIIGVEVADKGKFLNALQSEGYDVNGWGDAARKVGQGTAEGASLVLQGLAGAITGSKTVESNPVPHAFDNARAPTRTDADPQLHFYNEAGDNHFSAHWDRTSSNGTRQGPIGHIIGAARHNSNWASPQRVNQYLKEVGKAPR